MFKKVFLKSDQIVELQRPFNGPAQLNLSDLPIHNISKYYWNLEIHFAPASGTRKKETRYG
jgi:hypothetical protein